MEKNASRGPVGKLKTNAGAGLLAPEGNVRHSMCRISCFGSPTLGCTAGALDLVSWTEANRLRLK